MQSFDRPQSSGRRASRGMSSAHGNSEARNDLCRGAGRGGEEGEEGEEGGGGSSEPVGGGEGRRAFSPALLGTIIIFCDILLPNNLRGRSTRLQIDPFLKLVR